MATKEEAVKELVKVMANVRAEGQKAFAAVQEQNKTRSELRREQAALVDMAKEVEKKEKERKDTIR